MVEPEILKTGKEFHRRVQEDWERTAKDGHILAEHKIPLAPKIGHYKKHGRLDIFVDETGDFVSVVEIKSTDWDSVLPRNRSTCLQALWPHPGRNQNRGKAKMKTGIEEIRIIKEKIG